MPKGQIVLYQGEASTSVYVVRKGVVRAYTILENGNQVIIALFGGGDYFPFNTGGEAAIVAPFYYDMMSDGEVELVAPEDFAHDGDNQLEVMHKRYLGALLHINALAQASAYQRLVHTIRYLAMRFGESTGNKAYTRIPLKLTQQDLAELSNLSRETTNAELRALKKKNVVLVREKLYTINMTQLGKIINDDLEQSVLL